ncbi:stage II sporulation protein R [Caldalkalibacillus thermarum TA2.A1]|uniref:Stage II sporulation protein R n=1 Tax=Caldalkalibacillus thermarum (strain TA2.A1) TaxID=986075 RepID=A0A8X8I4F2_CALTT|nr:stage II sporulation protein R [Caldalkalibacillus thermarum]QZT34185.1 stage II sporulation protein R [Caldalkalibacillus thermarum TA2.A1]
MNKRFYQLYMYVLTGLVIVVMSWEYQRATAASLVVETEIPEESLRLRILANSDSPRDQWLKEEVMVEVVELVSQWAGDMEDIAEAREVIAGSLDELEQVVGQTIQSRGFNYSYSVRYGQIPFPTKLYGSRLYPAGEYEGVLITIGAGQGENWWCVLFPPLCFVDFGIGDVLETETVSDQRADGREGFRDGAGQKKDTGPAGATDDGADDGEQELEIRFFLVELLAKVKSLFV